MTYDQWKCSDPNEPLAEQEEEQMPIPTEPIEFDQGTIARNLRGLASRMQYRVEAIEIRDGKGAGAITGPGVGIGYLLAKDLTEALGEAASFIEGHARAAPPAQEPVALSQVRSALDQIQIVCEDNAAASCNKAMALDFVRQVATAALRAIPNSPGPTGLAEVLAKVRGAEIAEDCAEIAEGHVGATNDPNYDEACRDIAKAIRDAHGGSHS